MARLLDCLLPGSSSILPILSRGAPQVPGPHCSHTQQLSICGRIVSVRSRLPPQSSLFSCTPDWSATDLEVFHQVYASSNVLQPPSSSLPPFRRSADTLRPGQARGSPSGSEVCRTWNNGRCTSGFSQCKRHKCDRCHGPHCSLDCPSAALYRRPRSRSRSPPRAGGSSYAH